MRQLGFALSGADAAVDLEALGVTQDGEHPGRPGRLDLQQFLDIVDVHGLSHAGEKGAEAEFLRHVTRTGDCGWWGEAPTSVENAP